MQSAAPVTVWVNDTLACVRISGRANVAASVDFKRLIENLISLKPRRFVVDLSECILMDSTFLGVLAGIGQRFTANNSPDNANSLELFNPSERVAELIDNLGLMDFFTLCDDNCQDRPDLNRVTQEAYKPAPREVTRTCLEAHHKLMELNPDNVPVFKDVTTFLEQDLKRQDRSKS